MRHIVEIGDKTIDVANVNYIEKVYDQGDGAYGISVTFTVELIPPAGLCFKGQEIMTTTF